MRLIKLDAIDSTNDFLKGLSGTENIENFTVVTAENQTKGKGQRGAAWNSEIGKNLIMSVLIKDFGSAETIFNLNIAISIAVIRTLKSFDIPHLSVKWPNDILSGNKKVGGILIENTIKSDRQIVSIAGLGLNINQANFENLPNATSLSLLCNMEFDKDKLLNSIIENLQNNIYDWGILADLLWSEYKSNLFKKDIPMPFLNPEGQKFMGVIVDVSPQGKLQVLMEDGTVAEFGIREIQMLY
jgi:BirA family transcriptional regulator, biotin operon repressor / biotin---[acetyl-CoA-carboxylase] ligase